MNGPLNLIKLQCGHGGVVETALKGQYGYAASVDLS